MDELADAETATDDDAAAEDIDAAVEDDGAALTWCRCTSRGTISCFLLKARLFMARFATETWSKSSIAANDQPRLFKCIIIETARCFT